MSAWTVLCYLFGGRRAILHVARAPSAIWLGLLLVGSAGLAREYDGEDLLREPWHLLLPVAASLVTSFVLFVMLWITVRPRQDGLSPPTWGSSYLTFLALYWMTAPLAWLYALPVERFLSAADATRANLMLLALVAGWRVLLITRVAAVLFDAKATQVFPIVMLFADTVMLVLLRLTPIPIIAVMGGIRLTESERFLQGAAIWLGVAGVLSWPLWLFGWAIVAFQTRRVKRFGRFGRRPLPVTAGAWAVGGVALLIGIAALPLTQPAQQLRNAVERDLRNGHIEQALAKMSAHQRDDFPPHWDPPPRIAYGRQRPDLLEVIDVMLTNGAAAWVREVYFDKLRRTPGRDPYYYWQALDNNTFDRLLGIMERLPEECPFVQESAVELKKQLKDADRTEDQKKRLRSLLGERDLADGDEAT